MANLNETQTYEEGIYQLETTDPVVGGPDGLSNTQAKQLANRTAWLKAQVEQLLAELDALGITDVTGLQAALHGKANADHAHSAADLHRGTLPLARLATASRYTDSSASKLALASAVRSLYDWMVEQLRGKAQRGHSHDHKYAALDAWTAHQNNPHAHGEYLTQAQIEPLIAAASSAGVAAHNHSADDISRGTLDTTRLHTSDSYTSTSISTLATSNALRRLRDWVRAQLAAKADQGHHHSADNISQGTLDTARLNTSPSYTSSSSRTVPNSNALRRLYDWVRGQLAAKADHRHSHSAAELTGTLAAEHLPAPTASTRGGHKRASVLLSASGYYKDNETGLLIQWGTVSLISSGRASIRWPMAFPNTPRSLTLGINRSVTLPGDKTDHVFYSSPTRTGVIFRRGPDVPLTATWMAIGS